MGAVKGVAEANRNLAKKIKGIIGATAKGLLRGALIIERAAKENAPIEFGTLIQSAFHRAFASGLGQLIGFFVEYAIYVHESPHVGVIKGGPKFLEKAAKEKQREVVEVVAKEVKVK